MVALLANVETALHQSGRKRYAVLLALSLVAVASFSCRSEHRTCLSGQTRCSDDVIQQCHRNSWLDWIDCASKHAACGEIDGDAYCVPRESDADSDTDADSDSDADVEADADAELEAGADSDSDADVEADADAKLEAGAEPDAQAEPDADLEFEQEVEPEPALERERDADMDAYTGVSADVDTDSGECETGSQRCVNNVVEHCISQTWYVIQSCWRVGEICRIEYGQARCHDAGDSDAVADAEAEQDAYVEPDAEPEPVAEPEPEHEPEPEPVAEPEPEHEPETEPVAELEPEPEPEPEPNQSCFINERSDLCCDNEQGYSECIPAGGRGGPYILIPGGTFWMGCRDDLNGSWDCSSGETPQHEVLLSDFGIDKHEITQARYKAFVDATGHRTPTCYWDPTVTPDNPVVCIDGEDTRSYCRWVGGDLPTEAQWEYVARGPMTGPDDYAVFPWGFSEIDCEHANYFDCSGQKDPVGSWPSGVSPFGVHDLSGNVFEWCLDWYDGDYYDRLLGTPVTDPTGPVDGSFRSLRGGSFCTPDSFARSAGRLNSQQTNQQIFMIGGRCVRGGYQTDIITVTTGSFWMGSPDGCPGPAGYPGDCSPEPGRQPNEDLHEVSLTRPFRMMAHEVTQDQFETLMGWNPSAILSCGADCPVEQVSWYDALAYANEMSMRDGLTPCFALSNVSCVSGGSVGAYIDCFDDDGTLGGIDSATVALNEVSSVLDCEGYRLPTEAEWEYAARSGSHTAFSPCDGNDGTITETECGLDPNLNQIAVYCGNNEVSTLQVGSKEPNAWGLYDMSGSVMEWVWDWFESYGGEETDPEGPLSGAFRVSRGGGWNSHVQGCRLARRADTPPNFRDNALGFRLSRSMFYCGEEVCTDLINGLVWQKTPRTSSARQGAALWECANLELAGETGWRLPAISELRSLIRGCAATETRGLCKVTDECLDPYTGCGNPPCWSGCWGQVGPADGCHWPQGLNGLCRSYWSSSLSNPVWQAWVVDFDGARIRSADKLDATEFRCVRTRP